jgi:hypothetical protein
MDRAMRKTRLLTSFSGSQNEKGDLFLILSLEGGQTMGLRIPKRLRNEFAFLIASVPP